MIRDAKKLRFVVCVIVCAAAVRVNSSLTDLNSSHPDAQINFHTADIHRIEKQVFDPDAAVLISPGDDLLPGQAGRDDDFDGAVDNLGEMGAVGSDDLCLAPWNDGYQLATEQPGTISVDRGAFVPAGTVTPQELSQWQKRDQAKRVRFLIIGRTGDSTWSRMILDR